MHDGQTSIPNSTIVLIESGTRTINNNENVLIAPSSQHSQLIFDDGTTTATATSTTVANALRSNNTIIIDNHNIGVGSGVVINNATATTLIATSTVTSAAAVASTLINSANSQQVADFTTSKTSYKSPIHNLGGETTTTLHLINNDQSYSESMDIDLRDGSFIDDDETSQGMYC